MSLPAAPATFGAIGIRSGNDCVPLPLVRVNKGRAIAGSE